MAPVAEAAPASVIETPAPAPVIETPAPIAEAPVAAPEPAPVVEAPVAVEQPVPVVETTAFEAPVVEQPAIEAPAAEAPVVEAPATETPVETPVAVEEAPAAPSTEPTVAEPATVVEEAKAEKAALDEFQVTEPDVVQRELLNAVEEIAENPLSQAPQEAHEEAAKATEVNAETQPATIQATKETLPEATSSSNENKE